MSEKKINIVITDDHQVVRKALISLLEESNRFTVIAEAENGRELLNCLKTIQPDVVLLDIEMPIMNGREALLTLKSKHPGIKVIVLSMHYEESLVFDMITNGASAFLSKDASADVLFEAIQAVVEQGSYYGNAVSNAIVKGLQQQSNINSLFNQSALSKREIQILLELCNGKTNKEIAQLLSISSSTVDFHRINIYKKTNCTSIADLVKYAIRNGIIKV